MDSASKDQKTSFDTAFISDDESNLTLLGDGTKSIATTRKRSSRRGSLMLKALLVLIALACAGSVLYTAAQVHQITTAAVIDYGDCGADGSVEEARAKGCVFDPMSWIWVRPECLDKPMIEDFMNRTDFSWHFDPKLTPESMVPLDVVYRGDHPKLFTQKKYHYVHCTVSYYLMCCHPRQGASGSSPSSCV